jgi:hypothetical protein
VRVLEQQQRLEVEFADVDPVAHGHGVISAAVRRRVMLVDATFVLDVVGRFASDMVAAPHSSAGVTAG